MNLCHSDVIWYLRDLDREIARRAETLAEQKHPMAAHFEADALKASVHIEATVSRLIAREDEQRMEWESRQPQRDVSDRENFGAYGEN